MIILKSGVKVCGIRPELLMAFLIAESLFDEEGEEMAITFIGGKHHMGDTADLGTAFLSPRVAEEIRDDLAKRLGSDYDVALEKGRLHIEFKPKLPHAMKGTTNA